MSYVVLARKWRPQSFEDLVGQEHVSTTLGNAIARDRVAHAFLFTGVRGVGKTTSARILAKALNCVHGPTATPCQKCAPCAEITVGADVDVQEIDGASYNGVDEVRKLQESLPYRPARDRFKIFIVDEVHMLSNAAWNAFLKTLEEPPPHVKFIFATTEVHKVPVTILSRCQRYDFKLIGAQAIAARLRWVLDQEKIPADDPALSALAREAAGSMRDAMSLLDQVIAWVGTSGDRITAEGVAKVLGVADRVVLHRLAGALVDGDPAACVRIVGELAQEGYDLPHVARDFLAHLRDLVVAKVCEDPAPLLDLADEEVADARALAARADADDLTRLHQGFSRAFDDIARSGQPRAALEMALVRLARRPPLLPIDELLRRLGDLERRLNGGGGGGGGGGAPERGPQRPGAPSGGAAAPRRGAASAEAAPEEARASGAAAGAAEGMARAGSGMADGAARAGSGAAANGVARAHDAAALNGAAANGVARANGAAANGAAANGVAFASGAAGAGGVGRATGAAAHGAAANGAAANGAAANGAAAANGLARANGAAAVYGAPGGSGVARAHGSMAANGAAAVSGAPAANVVPFVNGAPGVHGAATSFVSGGAAPAFAKAPPYANGAAAPAYRADSAPPPSPRGALYSVPQSAPPVAAQSPASRSSAPPAAQSPAPPSSAPPPAMSAADLATWRAVIAAVRAQRPALASVLEHAAVLELTPTRVALGYEANSFLAGQATEPVSRDLLARVLGAHFGGPAELVFETITRGSAGPSLAQVETAERKARVDAAKRAVAEHPLVTAAIELLGAELKDVRLSQDFAEG
ncbi:DNA polymerase III subunit gamma/tau [Sorangium sp. So ce375]|uniref:DNA polymerase III subunit gamma/tau n=1 Tax=Sorangium sp. So ce375 TaxID=3133306 RepID=UPI003F5BCB0C